MARKLSLFGIVMVLMQFSDLLFAADGKCAHCLADMSSVGRRALKELILG